jgi:hypothetical protein
VGRKEKLDLPDVQRSHTSPLNTNTPHPVPHPPPSHTLPIISPGSSPQAPESYSIPTHRQFKIREALGLEHTAQSAPVAPSSVTAAAIIGSPSKSSLERMRNEYFLQADGEAAASGQKNMRNDGQHRYHEQTTTHQDEDDEEFDVKRLRDKVQK